MDPGFPFKYLLKEVSKETRASKAKRGLCKHWSCKRQSRKGPRHDCNTCNCRKKRMNNMPKYIFVWVQQSARKRGIAFNLTFKQFMQFCNATGYLEHVGRESDSMTIDRIDSAKPYEIENIRALSYRENVSRIVDNMTDPREPIARALAKANNGTAEQFHPYLKEAGKILEQVEALQTKPIPIGKDPF